jgi:chemotaxis protein CheD
MTNTLSVGLGELVISSNPDDILVAYGLGSCVGIGMFSPKKGVAGLLHAVLPENTDTDKTSTKFVDTGIPTMLDKMQKAGADLRTIQIYMAGGANMLINTTLSKSFDIGTRNAAAARALLEKLGYKLVNSETGGNTGRTVRLYVVTGKYTVRMIGGQEREL